MRSDDESPIRRRGLAHPAVPSASMAMIMTGIALGLLSRLFDGFVYGMFVGVALALILLGVFLLGSHWFGGRGPGKSEGESWLPSRDGNP